MKYKSINFVSNNLIDVINKDLDNILQNMCSDYLLAVSYTHLTLPTTPYV